MLRTFFFLYTITFIQILSQYHDPNWLYYFPLVLHISEQKDTRKPLCFYQTKSRNYFHWLNASIRLLQKGIKNLLLFLSKLVSNRRRVPILHLFDILHVSTTN